MRILTVRQPWAWAIIHGGKTVENRSRNIAGSYRGPVAIHAGVAGASFDAMHPDLWPFDWRHTFGAIIGVADLVGVHRGTVTTGPHSMRVASCFRAGKPFGLCSPWAEHDAWHLELANARSLPVPIRFKGALGLRELDPKLSARIEREAVAE